MYRDYFSQFAHRFLAYLPSPLVAMWKVRGAVKVERDNILGVNDCNQKSSRGNMAGRFVTVLLHYKVPNGKFDMAIK